jgi:hypothetical protein
MQLRRPFLRATRLIRRDDNAYQSHYLAGQTKTKNRRVQLFMQSAVSLEIYICLLSVLRLFQPVDLS